MAESKQFNPLPLLSVKPGLDESLTQVSADLEKYYAEGLQAKESLQHAFEELHRTVGVLQMLDLKGLAVFSKEFETVLDEMLRQDVDPSNLHRDTLRGAMLALTQYLESLADGASNTALRLFYSYQELHQLRGLESAFEIDLFFPELGVDLPPEVLNVPLVPESLATVKKARTQYQRALLKWLRQESPEQSLKLMRSAVQTVMACAPQDEHRAFWWIATGLLDCLIHDGLPGELNANKLLARIDLQMKSMAENKTRDTEYNVACNMQYMLARSHPVSDTVDKIKQTYELATYLPETQPLPHSEAAKILEQMRESLIGAQELLEQCTQGDADCNSRFVEKLAHLHELSEKLDRNTLQFLCKQMHVAVTESTIPDIVQQIKMELAMAMVLLSSGIERYQRLNTLFHDQVRYINQFLLNGIPPPEMDEENSLANLSAIHCQAEEVEVLPPLASEMKANLQQIELTLNTFFSDKSKREELASLRRLLLQVNGGFFMLSLDVARKLIAPVYQAIERYLKGATPLAGEMHAIASAVSSLETYAHGLSQGMKPDTRLLDEVLESIQSNAFDSNEQISAPEAAMPSGVAVREGGEDAELLEVFLEEANEVLHTLNEHVEVCRRNPHNRDSLVIIRRSFHTLKGSGRMVGLTNLGEVAWSVEKALNKWLQDEKPATPQVLEMVGDAEVLFQHWVDKLRSGDSALIDTTALVAAAQRIESGISEEPEQQEETETEPPDIVIGGISLSPVLFGIAIDEASAIIETLQKLVLSLRKDKEPVINYEFVRAAHTLAGISRSTGFTDISDLAGALEAWLQELLDGQSMLDILQLNLLEQSINALADMVSALRVRKEPKPRTDLINRLQLKKKQLSKSAPPETQQAETAHAAEIPLPVAEPLPFVMPESDPAKMAIYASSQPEDSSEGEADMGLVSYATYLEQAEKQDEHIEPTASQANKIAATTQISKPQEDDIDLVAYVQRAVMEEAHAPLNWQSPDDKYNDEKDTAGIQEVSGKTEQSKPHRYDAFAIDLNPVIHEAEREQPKEFQASSSAEAPFNFDSLNLGIGAPAPVSESKMVRQNTTDSDSGNNVDFLSTIGQIDMATFREAETASQPDPFQSPDIMLPADDIVVPAPGTATRQELKSSKAPAVKETAEELSSDQKKRVIQDDLDDQLLPIFLEEADELYPQLAEELLGWRDKISDQAECAKVAHKLQRGLHTLKGSARMAGAMRLGELTHRVEDVVDQAVNTTKYDPALLEELEGYFDRIGNALDKLRKGEAFEDEAVHKASTAEKPASPSVPVQQKAAMTGASASQEVAEISDERKESAVLRVRSDMIDDLVNEAGEISVARSRMEVELSAVKGGLHDLSGSVQGLRKLVREIEMYAEGQMQARAAALGESAEKFDPLEFDRFTRFQELTRFMNESVHDVQTIQQSLLKNLDETSAAISAQSKLNGVLQQSLMSIRMLPFSSISQRLYRIVRQTGKELGKRANLELYGTEIEMDRSVLEKMTAPFEHLLRNSMVHGLESADTREKSGKPALGNISLSLRQEGNEMVFEFKDDGAGLDTVRIRKKAIDQGLIGADEIIGEEKIMLLIFEKGLSTASELTEIAGRGVGMDVVLSEIKGLGGRIEVNSVRGKGATFTIYLPLTLAVMKALMVRAGNETYAIPSVMVEQVQQIKPNNLIDLYREGQANWQGKSYPLHYLPRLLGDNERTPESKPYNAVILLRSGEQRMALHLDELIGNKEVVVKNVGDQLSRLTGIAGATVQADGRVVLILNPIPLTQQTIQTSRMKGIVEEVPVRRVPVVMIVDDSMTVRKITSKLLNRVGYEVVTAKDGVDALEQLVDIMPDVMLLDVEMPRMDGFELAKQLRRDAKTQNLPIIMITSRTAEKHRTYALELGVNEYMGKPYQDDELLREIGKFAPLQESVAV